MTMRRTTRSGFTLAELLMGLAISSLVLAAAASLAYAVNRAWATSENVQTVVNHGRNGLARISSRIRNARAVGHVDSQYFLLWREDSNSDGRINMSELTLYHYDSRANQLLEGQLVFSSSTGQADIDANNDEVTANGFISVSTANALMRNDYYREGAVAEHVSSITWVLDADPPSTGTVQLTVNVTNDGLTQTLHTGMSLRDRKELTN